ncbi:cytochrome P450 [Aspergillus pseudodeflectus]|uniref:Cytochrome P450 n=1 Tax=Aspergillus pseudodeflectus TaxID=176178 RepID=A0ABR4JYD7_9EURO
MLKLLLYPIPALILYITTTAIRSIYLHPQAHIPGPKSWIAFPILRHISAIRGRIHLDLCRFHATYGPVVRYGPDTLSIITEEVWPKVYGHGHRQLPKVQPSASNPRDILSANDEDHARYRKALLPAFSARGLQAQEPLIIGYVDKLIHRLREIAESGAATDMVKWYNLTTFDIIGDLIFGESFGGLDNSEYHHWVVTIFRTIKSRPFFFLMDEYPIVFRVLRVLMPRGFVPDAVMQSRQAHKTHTQEAIAKRLANAAAYNRNDLMDSMLHTRGGKNELSDLELEGNANLLLVAGSETVATFLSGTTYWLCRSPEVLDRLTGEVRSAFKTESEITIRNVSANLPYMEACINETFRIYPPVVTGMERRTVDPVHIGGYHIPPGTELSIPQAVAYTSSRNFYNPHSFDPARWLPESKTDPSSPYFNDNRDVVQQFSVGPRNCIGSNLAFAEIRLILARLLWNFDLMLCDQNHGWSEQRAYVVWEKGGLMCRLTVRGGGG